MMGMGMMGGMPMGMDPMMGMPMGMDPMMGGMMPGMDPMMGMGPQGMMDPMMGMGPQGMMGPGMGPQGMMDPMMGMPMGMGPMTSMGMGMDPMMGGMGMAFDPYAGMPGFDGDPAFGVPGQYIDPMGGMGMGMMDLGGGMGMGMDPMGNVILGMDMGPMGPDIFIMGGPGEEIHGHIGDIFGDPIFFGPDPDDPYVDNYIEPGTTTVAVTATSLDVTGSAGSVHTGSGVSDSFTAGPGKSTFTGGGAADQMKFTTLRSNAEDTFLDFTSGTDKIKFTASVYTGFSGNTLGNPISANQLYQDTGVDAAVDGNSDFGTANHRIAYDPDSGKVYYDPTGNADDTDAVLIAILGDTGTYPTTVVAGDFIVI
jgi:hypothetical protein